MHKKESIFICGHNGMVGSAINKKLTEDNDIINLAGLGNKTSKTKNNLKDFKKH